ncbi:conserved hypothetical protein [Alteracholeplasma palmae J233]|uniref:YqeY-like protein n=1 Tax=Alteracholeplasma palmae (strain ATCC 49389 / J233) TaxID=1318466 RepID=U4KKX9_ALTPJ|nr:GatB/YqeY domain-containing protein [Alteracholeplasma palmae]CCV64474.1 conserved hypothetical protein [Alteracholeplasma palmae J233]
MLNKIKELRIKAMKEKDLVARNTYESVYSAAQTLKGRESSDYVIDDAKVVDLIKKEIKIYTEMSLSKDVSRELELLNNLLPKQLDESEIKKHFMEFKKTNEKPTPKEFMEYLDQSLNLKGQYDKGLVARIVMSK